MAQQHFYSRVPARMSIFNKTDSFDTFAYSEGLDAEFIEKELSDVYDNKPSKNDAVLIRNNQLPPVFLNLFTKTGAFVQGCITFLPLDYTGERSAYLAHTLVPSKEEEKEIIDNKDNAIFTSDMFKKDLSDFEITSPDANPNNHYPLLKYIPAKASNTDILLEYDSAMMKRLIFAMINLACGKGKTIFISLPAKLSDFSEKALNFINTVIQIFPYSLRRSFSFVTYTDDASRFPAFNIRFIPEHSQEIPASKGITLHMGFKIAVGISDEVVASSALLVEFFYNLIKDDSMRRSFIDYIDNAIVQVPELQKMTIKTLTELVFLFQQCSGLFNEKNVLPNDQRVFDYVCAYEKHRLALSEDFRAISLKCLSRYPQNHLAIPKEIFSRIVKIYPSEPISSKHTVMNTVLELIHTDVMRDKLFSFIKSNYDEEDSETREMICKDLCRVYYGGFLQSQIIDFWAQNFNKEPENVRELILEKLFLTIRTESVRVRIIEFLNDNYSVLNAKQKAQLYNTFYEMLPECDKTASDMLLLVEKNIKNEAEDLKLAVEEKLYSLVETNQRTKEQKLLSFILEKGNFSATAITKQIFSRSENKLFVNYVNKFESLALNTKLQLIDNIWSAIPNITSDVAERFATMLCSAYNENKEKEKYDLFAFVEIDKSISKHLQGTDAEKVFAKTVLESIVYPGISKTLPQAFSIKRKRDGLDFIIDYSKDKQYIEDAENYANIRNYINIVEAINAKDNATVISESEQITDRIIRQNVSEYLKNKFLNGNELLSEEFLSTRFMLELIVGYMKNQEFNFSAPYSAMCAYFAKELTAANDKQNPEIIKNESNKKAVICMLDCAYQLYASSITEEEKSNLTAKNSSFAKTLVSFVNETKKGKKYISEQLPKFTWESNGFKEKIQALALKSSGGFFSKLFSKK